MTENPYISYIDVGVFAVQSCPPPPLSVTANGDQSLEFNPRKPGTTMAFVNQIKDYSSYLVK